MREAGLKRAQDFQWSAFNDLIVSETDRVVNGNEASGRDRQEEDQAGTA
jgi:hypothetical protein